MNETFEMQIVPSSYKNNWKELRQMQSPRPGAEKNQPALGNKHIHSTSAFQVVDLTCAFAISQHLTLNNNSNKNPSLP